MLSLFKPLSCNKNNFMKNLGLGSDKKKVFSGDPVLQEKEICFGDSMFAPLEGIWCVTALC